MARRKKADQPQDNINESSDDTFGLPEIEYEPLKRDEEPEPEPEQVHSTVTEETYTSTTTEEIRSEAEPVAETHEDIFQSTGEQFVPYDEEEAPSVWPKILGVLALLLIVGAGVWYFAYFRPEQLAAERARQEQLDKETADKKAKEDARLAEEARLADEQRRADSLANAVPAIGTIETLSERTGRYYVIIASGVDGDLIMDYAKKLSPKGVSSKVIPPSGKVKFYRLAVAEGDSYASTQSTADGLKSEYEGGAWVIKF